MNDKDLESIKTRLGKATAGEWVAESFEHEGGDIHIGATGELIAKVWIDDACEDFNPQQRANADFIAHSKQDIESLLGEVGRLQNKIDSMTTITVEADTVKLHTQIQELQQENSRLKTMNYALSQGKVLELQFESQRYRTALGKIRDSQNVDDFHYLATRCAMTALR